MESIKSLRTLIATLALFVFTGNSPQAEADIAIKHKPVSSMLSGHRTNVSVKVKDKKHGIDIVRAYFKTPEESRYYFVDMANTDGDNYVGTLPAAALGAGVMDYLIVVKNGADEVVKSQNYTAQVEDDPEALARLEQKPARDVRIDVTCRSGGEQMFRQVRSASKKKGDEEEDEPTQEMWLPLCSDYDDKPGKVAGIDDYVTMAGVLATEKLGVVVGIVDEAAAGDVSTAGLSNGGTVAASSGPGVGTIAVGVAAVAGAAAAASSGGGGSGSDGGVTGAGTQLLPTISTPNGAGSQVAPLSMEFNEFNGVAVPITATYDGAPMGSGTVPAGGTLTFSQPAVGGLIRVTLTADVVGASLQFHFNSNGGRSPSPVSGHPITGSAGDYVLLQTLP